MSAAGDKHRVTANIGSADVAARSFRMQITGDIADNDMSAAALQMRRSRASDGNVPATRIQHHRAGRVVHLDISRRGIYINSEIARHRDVITEPQMRAKRSRPKRAP